jgi:hypothetical protein
MLADPALTQRIVSAGQMLAPNLHGEACAASCSPFTTTCWAGSACLWL